MHCLVTGATGYIGQALLPALLARGCRVTAQAGQRRLQRESGGSVREVSGELSEFVSSVVLDDVDVVFHLAGIAHQDADAVAYRRVNVDATLLLADRARAAGVARFVFFSSSKAAFAELPPKPDTGVPAATIAASERCDYAQSKRLAELGLMALFGTEGDGRSAPGSTGSAADAAVPPLACTEAATQLVIVRPALVYGGREKGQLALLRRWVDWHLPRPPAGGRRSMVALDDVVRLALELLDLQRAVPPRLTLTDGEAYSSRRLHAALCHARNRHPWLPSPPPSLWRAACAVLDGLRGVPRGRTWQRLVGEELSAQEGLAELAFTPRLSFERAAGPPS